MLTKYHNLDKISQIQPDFKILSKISQFWPTFTMLMDLDFADSAGNADI